MKLVALDMDGTLLNSKGKISPTNRIALREFVEKKKGCIAICSARPLSTLLRLLQGETVLSAVGFIAGFNGGQIYDVKQGKMIFEKKMTRSDIRSVDSAVKLHQYDCHFFTEKEIQFGSYSPPSYYTLHESKVFSFPNKKYPLSEIFNSSDIFKITVCGNRACIPVYQDEIRKNLPFDFQSLITGENYIDIQPAGIDKGYAVELIKSALSITEDDVVAVGDQQNDLPMFNAAGVKVAMGNAKPDVQDAADVVTLSNDRDGVACVINRLIYQ